MDIEVLDKNDLEHISHLQPPDWSDIMPRMRFYVASDYCYPIKVKMAGKIVGIGTAIVNEGTGWLANIIVDPIQRGEGVGTKITRHVMDILEEKNCSSMLLIATELGEPVYKKLGFETETSYSFLEGSPPEFISSDFIKEFDQGMKKELFSMDAEISGEIRNRMLTEHLGQAVAYVNQKPEGFYLPQLGEGMIIADTDEAGIELLKYKMAHSEAKVSLPIDNKAGFDFLNGLGFTPFRKEALRMHLGKKITWQPGKLFSRTGGHYG